MTPDSTPPPAPLSSYDWHWELNYPPYRRDSAPITISIVVSVTIVYLAQLIFHFFYRSEWLSNLLAFSPEAFEEGGYWRIITYAWIHSEALPIHILFNMLMVWVLGGEIERVLGSWRFAILYLGGTIFAALTFWFWAPFDSEAVAGASGAAFALLTSLAVLSPKRRLSVLLFMIIPMRMRVLTLTLITCGVEVACELFGWLSFISHTAHLGGAFMGVILTFLFKPPKPPPPPVIFTTGIFPPI